jgi:hypothetical protein
MAYEAIIQDELIKGDTWAGHEITINKEGFNFSGSTVKIQFKAVNKNNVLLEITPAPSVATTGQLIVTVNLTASQTAILPPGDVVADVQITTGAAVSSPILFRLKIIQDITT